MVSILNDTFDKIYYINLDKRTDRLASIQHQLQYLDIKAERFSAVKENPIGWSKNLLSQEVACAWSHLKIIEMAKEQNLNNVLILEDDALFTTNFEFKFYEAYNKVPQDWQLIYLGGNNNCIINDKISHRLNNSIYISKATLTTSAYAIKKKVYDLFIDRIKTLTKTLDMIYCELQQEIKAYCLVPALVSQYESYSDIQMQVVNYKDSIK